MIEGSLQLCINMEALKDYVDIHGQSEVAFCYLLDF